MLADLLPLLLQSARLPNDFLGLARNRVGGDLVVIKRALNDPLRVFSVSFLYFLQGDGVGRNRCTRTRTGRNYTIFELDKLLSKVSYLKYLTVLRDIAQIRVEKYLALLK